MPIERDIELPDIGIEATLTAGIHAAEGGEAHEHGNTLAEVASFHEHGLGVPTRSFLRAWFDEHEQELGDRFEAALGDAILEGKSPTDALDRLAEWVAGGIKERIYSNIPPELSETVKRKRGDGAIALISSGQLISAIRAELQLRLGA